MFPNEELSIINVLLIKLAGGFKLPTLLDSLATIMTTNQGMRKEMIRLNNCNEEWGGMLELVVASKSASDEDL